MADATYQSKVYQKQGGDEIVVAAGGRITVESGGVIIGPNPSGGVDYYVAGNYGLDTNDGLSWAKPFLTVAAALAASHANIATSPNWAKRNRVFISGDSFTENLVAFAQKTDVIGVGSCDGIPTARIIGNHAPVNTAYGCRFFNIDFNCTALVAMTLIAGVGGAQFIGCYFSADGTATTGILATGGTDWVFRGNQFRGWDDANGFTTAAISLGTGASPRTIIEDNAILHSAKGVLVHASRTGFGSVIRRNTIVATGLVIDDAGGTFYVSDNILISGGAVGATSHVFAAAKAANNYVTGSDKTSIIPALA